MNGESLVLTFFPHPRMVLRPEEHGVELLSTTTEKVDLLRESGISHLVIQPFSRDFSAMSASQFIQTIIVQKLQTETRRRGSSASGNAENAPRLELRSIVGTNEPIKPICGCASGTLIAPVEVGFASCGRNGTGP